MKIIRIMLADDHAVLRAGLRLLIDSQVDMRCIGEAGDSFSTLRQVEQLRPDVLLLDITMPRQTGLSVLSDIRHCSPSTRIVILTMHADDAYLQQALDSGAVGYVLKQAADQELLNAIRAVMRDEVYIHPAMTRKLLERMVHRSDSGQQRDGLHLSEREEDVIKQVARGYTNQEIADKLSLSVKTVETYRGRAMRKLGLRNRASLVRYALKEGWLHKE